jgi:glycosyltransferase involved in cell wall biosynthesis
VFTDTAAADIVHLRSSLCNARRRVLFEGAAAVLANSGHEPFGLVGLETMAAGGVACTGGTGEDYVVPGWNALVSQTTDAREFVDQFLRLQTRPAEERALRRRGRSTARIYEWSEVIKRSLLPRLQRPMQRVGVRQRVPRPVYPRPDTLSPRLVSTER